MKKKLASAVAVCLCLATGLAFAFSLFRYAMPTRDASYSLSIGWEGEALPENWVYDQKGWSVYIQEGGQVTALLADETGFFTGALEPGGVFYYARTLTETLDQPTLRIAEGSFALAVFLDDTLLYADADIGDGRPGSLALPELSVPRRAQQIELPDDYQGKTLTVAQRIADSARPDGLVFAFLTPMTLCSGYAYESGLIAESFRAAIPNTLLLALGLALLALFAVFACRGQWNGPVLCAALALLLWMVNRLSSLSFSPVYVGQRAVDPAFFSRCCSLNVLLLFHAFQARRLRVIPALFAALNTLPTLLCLALALTASSQSALTVLLYDGLFQFSGFLGLLAIVVCSWLLWRKEGVVSLRGNSFLSTKKSIQAMQTRMPAVECNCYENKPTADRLYSNDEWISTGHAAGLRSKH